CAAIGENSGEWTTALGHPEPISRAAVSPHDTDGSAYCVPVESTSCMNTAPAGGVNVASRQPHPVDEWAPCEKAETAAPCASRQLPATRIRPRPQPPTLTTAPARPATHS